MPMATTSKNLAIGSKHALHLSRWQRIKSGLSYENVAEADGVGVLTIRKSFQLIETHKTLYSMASLETSQIEMIESLQSREKASLEKAFDAVVRQQSETPYGTVVTESPNHEMALAASTVITARIAALQPRRGGVVVNASASATASAAAAGGGNVSFESQLRKVLQERQEQQSTEPVIDVPVLSVGQDDEDFDDQDSP
jgi:hypothetical protein